MSKSVLVIDTPESCVLCPLSYYNERHEEHQCRGLDDYKTIENWYRQCVDDKDPRPEWCPLSTLPEEIKLKQDEETVYDTYSLLMRHYAKGWNDFREELMEKNK